MATSIEIPRRLPLLLVVDSVLLPGASMRIPVRSIRNINMVKSRLLHRNTLDSTIIGVVPHSRIEYGEELQCTQVTGTAAVVVQVTGTNWPSPSFTLLVTGLCRLHIEELLQEVPYPVARVSQLASSPGTALGADDEMKRNAELENLVDKLRTNAMQLIDMLDGSIPIVAKFKAMLESVPTQHLPDVCASIVRATPAEKVEVLDAVDLIERFRKTLPLLTRQIEGLKVLQKAGNGKLRITMGGSGGGGDSHRVHLRNALRKLPPGEQDEDQDEIAELAEKIKSVGMSRVAETAASKELRRLRKMPQQMPEHAMIRNYLELLVDLPWNKMSTDALDIALARRQLDADHYGMEKLKKRVIEYLAVRRLKNSLRGPILCFVGPPGVGKTSIGRSIAQTLGRQFHRIALGGICDQSDIRGHRRTYIGSMPGRVIQGLKMVGVRNPVFLLDEVDKLSKGIHGDPAAALLEVLDPEQNHAFVDHYVNVPFDLSQVLFIATANSAAPIPAALRDRMELVHVSGYASHEKVCIARAHLVPRQLDMHGLSDVHMRVTDDALVHIISHHTLEAGVRSLERCLSAVCRAVAVKVAEVVKVADNSAAAASDGDGQQGAAQVVDLVDTTAVAAGGLPPTLPIVIDEHAVDDILGPPRYASECRERMSQPGVAAGLAWTIAGGSIMFVEASRMAGDGQLTLTGQLGDVMKESASLALNWVRAHADQIGVDARDQRHLLEKTDVHVHFPSGGVSKDGPSAGVTVAVVLVSLFTGRCVRIDTAMTGELTLRGVVLPVGGVKEKVLAAHRSGILRVILPKRNEKDLHEVPADIRDEMTFVFASSLEEVLAAAFDGDFPQLPSPTKVAQVSSKL